MCIDCLKNLNMSKPQMYRVRKGENEMLVSEFTLNKRAQKEGFVVIAEVFYRGDGSTKEVPTPGHEKTVNDASKIGFVPEEIANLRAKKAEADTKAPEDIDPNKVPGDFSGVKIHEGNPVEVTEPKSVAAPAQSTSADIDPNKVETKVTAPAKADEPAPAETVKPKNNKK